MYVNGTVIFVEGNTKYCEKCLEILEKIPENIDKCHKQIK